MLAVAGVDQRGCSTRAFRNAALESHIYAAQAATAAAAAVCPGECAGYGADLSTCLQVGPPPPPPALHSWYASVALYPLKILFVSSFVGLTTNSGCFVVAKAPKSLLLVGVILHWTGHMSCNDVLAYTADAFPAPRLFQKTVCVARSHGCNRL